MPQNADAAKLINDQIELELENLNAFMTEESEKPAILDRIERLKKMVDDPEISQPHVDVKPAPVSSIFRDVLSAFARR